MMNYNEMAKEFCKNTNTKVTFTFNGRNTPNWSDKAVNTYKVLIKRNGKQFTVTFYDSIHNTQNGIKPTEYDVLACLTKYDVGEFQDFCHEFGYDVWEELSDSLVIHYNRKSYKIYKAVTREYKNVLRMFEDVMEELQEIY